MRAVIVCAASAAPLASLTRGAPPALLPLVDRPFLQHLLERLADQGFRQVDLVLSDAADAVERLVGDGRRWGLEVTVHLARDPHRPYRAIPPIEGMDPVLLGHADRIPGGDWRGLLAEANAGPLLVTAPDGQWSGWAALSPDLLNRLPGNLTQAGLEAFLAGRADGRTCPSAWMLDAATPARLIESQQQVLEGRIPEIVLQARRIAPGIWAGRGAMIHPQATLIGPAFVGELAEIGAGARLGPNTVVGARSTVSAGCTLADALVSPDGFVGPSLELNHAIVAGNHLLNVPLGVVVQIPDRALLAPLAGTGERPVGWGSRLVAAAALVCAIPVLCLVALVLFLVRGRVLHYRTVVLTPVGSGRPGSFKLGLFEDPASPASGLWSSLLLRVLPGLPHAVAGRLGLVGTEPRTAEEISRIPPIWQEQILRIRPGLLSEGLVNHGPQAGEADRAMADAWYAAHASRRYDLRLLRALAIRLVRGRPVPVPVPLSVR